MNRIALSISAVWHLLCIFSLRVVILPEDIPRPQYASIAFVGPLLERLYIQDELFERAFDIKKEGERTVSAPSVFLKQAALEKPQVLVGEDSNLPRSEDLEPKPKRSRALTTSHPLTGGDFQLEGDVRKGQILSLPQPPDYRIIDKRLAGKEVALKFSISPNGTVRQVEKLISSGDPSLDVIWIRYILRWRFQPLLDGDATRWGVVKFKI